LVTKDPAQELLDRVLDHVRSVGLSPQLSMRQLAQDIGTSHRMLCYHFGSRDGLLDAVLQALRVEEQAQLLEQAGEWDRVDAVRALWSFYADPANRQRLTTFFYVFGLAAQEPGSYAAFLGSLDNWATLLADLGAREEGFDPLQARREADMVVATIRGLFMQLVGGADQQRVEDDFEVLVEKAFTRTGAASRTGKALGRRR
jgi:AcrR family transcriptional regulator